MVSHLFEQISINMIIFRTYCSARFGTSCTQRLGLTCMLKVGNRNLRSLSPSSPYETMEAMFGSIYIHFSFSCILSPAKVHFQASWYNLLNPEILLNKAVHAGVTCMSGCLHSEG